MTVILDKPVALTEAQTALLPTDDEVRAYRQHGWYHSKTVFTDAEIDAVLAGSERFYAGVADDSGAPALEPWRRKVDGHPDYADPRLCPTLYPG